MANGDDRKKGQAQQHERQERLKEASRKIRENLKKGQNPKTPKKK